MTSDKQTLKIDLNKDTTLVLQKRINQGNIWGININIVGNITDTISLIRMNGNNFAPSYKLIGGVDTTFRSDWYSDSCFIRFENVKVPIMDIQIDYEFFD